MEDLHRIEIPFGVSYSGETVSIPLIFPHRNHCFITGSPGTGKSTILKVIVEATGRNYEKSQVIVWTDYFSHNNEICQNASILKVPMPEDINPEDRMIALLGQLYDETQNRLQVLSIKGVSSFRQADSMPLLIAVIDDFHPFDYPDHGGYASEKLWTILRMSHAVGISLICSSQLPISRVHGMTSAMADLFNIRIALRTFNDFIYEALGVNPSDVSKEERKAIDSLSSGGPGDFLYYNRYEIESFVFGQVETMTTGQ